MKKIRIVLIGILALLCFVDINLVATEAAYYSGGFANVSNLEYRCAATGTFCSDFWDSSATSWNGISSKVKITKNQTMYSNGWPVALVSVDTATTGASGVFGMTYFYKGCTAASCNVASKTDTWSRVSAYVYTNVATTAMQRKETATHEIGHVLSMDHNNNTSNNLSIMTLLGPINKYIPQTYDRNELKKKWGN